MTVEGAIATNRFALGAKPGEMDSASLDPKAWLLSQFQQPAVPSRFSSFPSTRELVANLVQRRMARRTKDRDAVKQFLMETRQTFLNEMAVRFTEGFETNEPFRERLVRFWSNHFVVSIQKPQCALFAGAFEREAIRPHIAGNFADMVLAVERHPAMQLYLDNAQSIGPDSMAGMVTGKGLNENLGREILELHTLGVNGGYSQSDVIALAKILTGWSVDRGPGPMQRLVSAEAGNGFRFYPPRHEPGQKMLLGKAYPAGYQGGEQALRDLALHPATAHHIAVKLATHFISDQPPEDSVRRIETAFRDSGGGLMKVYEAIVDDSASWNPAPAKFRSPVEFVTAAMRAVSNEQIETLDEQTVRGVIQSARAMGEMPFAAPSPKGWPDSESAWTGSEAILQRIEWANAAGERLGSPAVPMRTAEAALGPFLSQSTRTAILRAASPAQGMALLFVSPEFQRR
jgi:uncharacterized protein (DUF1800 family)